MWPAGITRQDRIEQVSERIEEQRQFFDPALAMRDAENRGLALDAFVIVTANCPKLTHSLERYRRSSGIAAKLVVIDPASETCYATDPDDAWQLGVVGFDASVPRVVAEFLRGGRSVNG